MAENYIGNQVTNFFNYMDNIHNKAINSFFNESKYNAENISWYY